MHYNKAIMYINSEEPPQGINILLFSQIAKRALRARQFEFFNEGFGEGNFRALFESIELDQIRRGVLQGGENVA